MVHRLTPRPEAVADVSLYRYALPLRTRISAAEKRTGVLMRLVGKDDLVGWGEAAPLPGFSDETVDDVLDQAQEWGRGSRDTGCATLAFAIDSAIDDLKRRRETKEQPHPRRKIVHVNALVNGSGPHERHVMDRLNAGYRCFKLKVGTQSIDAEIERVRRLRTLLPADVGLRLDANRAWSYGEAARFWDGVADLDIAYIEEPVRQWDDLLKLADSVAIPIALDETVREIGPEELDSLTFARAIVLKPALLGGMDVYRGWIDAAQRHGLQVVLTGAYESGVSTQRVISLAAELESDAAHGLSTYEWLADDVLKRRLPVGGPSIDVGEVERAGAEVDIRRLEHVATL